MVFLLDKKKISEILKAYGSPIYIYDEKGIIDAHDALVKAFSWVKKGFSNYYAVKACPNPHILKILEKIGSGFDCSSLAELVLVEKMGIKGERILFTSNNTSDEEFKKAKELGAIINLDDITHINVLESVCGIPEKICFRLNHGKMRTGNSIIGNPVEAKFGIPIEDIIKAYKIAKKKGVKKFGLHTMIVSNTLNVDDFQETAKILFDLLLKLKKELDIDLEFVNLGGGIGIPYRTDQKSLNLNILSKKIKEIYYSKLSKKGISEPKLFMECGRYITGPHGYLISKVRHVTKKYRNFVGLDASMSNLMRPGMYGAYHKITVLGKEKNTEKEIYDVTGSLCENNDKFAIQRELPIIERGDIVVIHDVGAHGHSMGFQYNGKLRSAEVLAKKNGTLKLIRRAETNEDYFSTLDFSDIK